MIHRPKRQGRPGERPIVCRADTPQEAMRVVQLLRPIGIRATWAPRAPYELRVASDAHARATAYLTGLGVLP